MFRLHELNEALDEIETGPQNQSRLSKIKKAIESDYKKGLLEHVDNKEVDLLKVRFEKILNDDLTRVDDIVVELDKYLEDSDNQPYTDVVERLKSELISEQITEQQFLDFARGFFDQNFPIDIFYKQFFKRSPIRQPTMTDLFGEELSDSDTESSSSSSSEEEVSAKEEEEAKLAKVRDRIEQTRVEPRVVQETEPRAKGKVALVKESPVPKQRVPEPKPVADKVFFETMADLTKQDCEFLYKKNAVGERYY
ncbi:hypothetical protein DH26_gp057 [Chloriridovirus anopheles1]|uniref:Uncharacterized protein n=1 Tax=Chloriridovirus anopheles1 TaxID=1465751 RepID=W8QE36_9VIRU|nr:hypothetical protein DH26_gp057 [Anopheles minimus iridovirus]AHL67550.1 hypothetical protein AMIV_057 [Anopheles minimus iridovirus]